MTEATLPPGTKVCPGWSSEWSPEQGVSDGYASRYMATKASGLDVKYRCGEPPNGRKSDPSVIRESHPMCSRCARQKKKFDEENGERDRRLRNEEERYRGLIDAYAKDLGNIEGTFLVDIVTRLDGLELRSPWAPHARRGEEGFRIAFMDKGPDASEKLDVLRSLAGLPLQPRGGIRR